MTINHTIYTVNTKAAHTQYHALMFLPVIRLQATTITVHTTSNDSVSIDGLAIIR